MSIIYSLAVIVVKGERFGKWGAMVGFHPNNSESYRKVGRESVVLTPLWVRINRWLRWEVEGSSECEMGFGWVPGAPWRGSDWPFSQTGGVWITWSFGWSVIVCKGTLTRCCPSSSSSKPNMRVVLPGSGEEVKLGENLLGYGWKMGIDDPERSWRPSLTLVLEVRVFHVHFSSSVY